MITALNLSSSLPISRPHILLRRRINTPRRRLTLSPTIAGAAASPAGRTANMPPPPPATTLYDILGLSEEATIREIRSAYRIQARGCHPDAAASTGSSNGSAEEFLRLHAAYSVISDPTKRAEYDRELNAKRILRGSPTRVYRFSGKAPRRTWETDQCW